MKSSRKGQIVKFHTPYEDEDPNQLYLILEYIDDNKRSRVKIKALDTGFSFPPISTFLANDLVVDEVKTLELDFYLE